MKKRVSEQSHDPGRDTTGEDNNPDQTRKTSRRRLLGALGIGSGAAFVPPFWHKPVVKGLILPAHAQTSPTAGSFSFSDPCSVSLVFEASQVGVGGCTGGQATFVIPVVNGAVVGDGDPSGIVINIQSVLDGHVVNVSTVTDGAGNYQVNIDGIQTSDGPHLVCTQDCDDNFPSGGTVVVTATSDDSRLPGQAVCTADFDCEDIENPMGSVAEGGNRASNTFYVEMTPVDPSGGKV